MKDIFYDFSLNEFLKKIENKLDNGLGNLLFYSLYFDLGGKLNFVLNN